MTKSAASIPKISQYLENPVPHLHEAQEAATRIVHLQSELITVKAESAAIRQGKRIAFGAAAGFSALLAIAFSFAWLTVSLHESGMHAILLALISLIFFAFISTILTFLATKKEHHA